MHIVEDNQFQINQQFKDLQSAISQAEKEALLQRLTNVNLAQDQLYGMKAFQDARQAPRMQKKRRKHRNAPCSMMRLLK